LLDPLLLGVEGEELALALLLVLVQERLALEEPAPRAVGALLGLGQLLVRGLSVAERRLLGDLGARQVLLAGIERRAAVLLRAGVLGASDRLLGVALLGRELARRRAAGEGEREREEPESGRLLHGHPP